VARISSAVLTWRRADLDTRRIETAVKRTAFRVLAAIVFGISWLVVAWLILAWRAAWNIE
jgi:hypothetical protein